jgi:Mg/Co/Ni transporter MgtE
MLTSLAVQFTLVIIKWGWTGAALLMALYLALMVDSIISPPTCNDTTYRLDGALQSGPIVTTSSKCKG